MKTASTAVLTALVFASLSGSASAQLAAPVDKQPAADDQAPPPATPPPAPPASEAPATRTQAPAAQPVPAPAPLPYPAGGVWAQPKPAQPVADQPVQEKKPLPPPGPPVWQALLGVRTSYFTGPGYDPFSGNDSLVQGTLGASRLIGAADAFSFAAAVYFEGGGSTSNARGEPTKLSFWRGMIGPEVRWHFLPQAYLFARPAAGVARSVASIDEGTTGTSLYARNWLAAADADAGAAFAFWDLRSESTDLRFWILADGGYGWVQKSDLELAPDPGTGPERTASLDLGKLALSGPYFRISLAGTF